MTLLRRRGESARIVGGGTLLYELESRGLLSGVKTLIDIGSLDFSYVAAGRFGLRIGASTTFTQVLRSGSSRSRPGYAAIRDALRAVRPVQVRNVATVAGALSSGLATLDLPPAAVALDASVVLLGPRGRRTIPVQKFLVGFLETALRRGEFLTEVRVPTPPVKTGSAFVKLEMNSVDWAVLSVAVRVTLRRGKVADSRVVFGGGVGAVPVRAKRVEAALRGKLPEGRVLAAASERARKHVEFTDDERASAGYRRDVSGSLLKQAIELAVRRAGKDSR